MQWEWNTWLQVPQATVHSKTVEDLFASHKLHSFTSLFLQIAHISSSIDELDENTAIHLSTLNLSRSPLVSDDEVISTFSTSTSLLVTLSAISKYFFAFGRWWSDCACQTVQLSSLYSTTSFVVTGYIDRVAATWEKFEKYCDMHDLNIAYARFIGHYNRNKVQSSKKCEQSNAKFLPRTMERNSFSTLVANLFYCSFKILLWLNFVTNIMFDELSEWWKLSTSLVFFFNFSHIVATRPMMPQVVASGKYREQPLYSIMSNVLVRFLIFYTIGATSLNLP